MDFERDWNVDAAADRQQAPDPGLAALAARVKAAPVQPGTLHTVTPNADGMVVLPAGTDIDKIDVDGRNLVVTLPDGTQMVILDGAVVVPRIVVGDVEIPSVNLAALLIGEEPQPAAGPPRSSGGNFLADDGAIGDPFGLGDLLPPTELQFSQPEEREILPIGPDDEPDVTIITPNQPAGATDATANVSEAGLGARNGGEPAGSAFGSNSHVTTGTIAVSAADGPALVTINGIAVTGADQAPIDTPLGMLIITGVGEDEISYRYVLKDNVVGTPPAEIFTVVVTDADGDQATATLTISIADDSPKAVNDVDSVTEDGPLTADGNVFSGSGGTDVNATDGVADVPGADGVVRVTTGVFQGTYGELTLSGLGDYRYVLNNSNPAVQFLTPGQTLTETFTYSITDADNSPSNATLTITINGADDGVRITGLTGEPGPAGAELTLFENDLTDGSSPDASALVQGGTFSISAADGLTTVTVDGVAVLTDGVFMGPKVVTTALGTLTIDTFTPTAQQGAVPTAGTFTYHFTLTDNSLAHSAAGADDIVQSFTVVATDRNGSDDTASLDVRIVDDQPVAVDDVDLVPAGSYGPQAGNVITGEGTIPEGAGKDVKGADDAHVAGVVAGVSEQALDNAETLGKEVHGLYGKLILAADGHYDYMRDPGTPGNVSDTFTYTLRDGDGDLSIATLRIDIANSDVSIAPTIGEGTVVDESGLIEGKSPAPGSNAGTGIDMTQGVITYSAPDGPATITINDIVIVKGTVIQTDKGELVIGNITGTSIEYSYSLTSNIDNSSQDPVTDDFKVTVTDVDGDSKTEILSITILDDRPMAVADVDSVKEDGPLVADGNVLTGGHGADANSTDGVADVQGADGAKVTGIAFGGVDHPVGVEGFVEIGGTYGTLHISAHGDYVYTLNNENGLVQGLDSTQTLTESFTYTITDNDPDHADRSQATLTITIAGNNDGVTIDGLNGEGAEEIVYEASLPGGSAQNGGALTQSGSFTLTALDGVKTVTIDGKTIFADDAFTAATIKNAYGTLSIDDFVRTTGADGDVIGGTIKYHYVLDDNTLLHTGANDGSLTDSFVVVVLDTDESRAEASLDITVVDDRPFAIDDVVGQEVENTPVEFNVISGVGTLSANVDTLGADGVNLAINGDISWTDPAHGTLTYLGEGRFHYEQVPGAAGEDSFTYTITDGDKDSSTATVTILLAGDSTPTVTVGDLVVSEAGLPNGTQAAGDGEIASGTMAITTGGDTLKMVEVEGKDGWVDVTGATDAVPVKVDGLAGTLRVTSAMGLDGVRHYSYSYTLTTNDPTHPDFNPNDGDGISGGADEKPGDSFAVRVTDSDDDVSLPDSIDVTVQDDAPLLSVFGPETVAEGGTVTGSWSQTIGADQPGAIQVVVNGSTYDLDSPINTGKGLLTVNGSNHSWTFVAANNLDNSVAQSVSFAVQVTDADNDVAQDVQTITIDDGAVPTAGPALSLLVDDQNLADGTTPAGPDFQAGTVSFTAGSDALTGFAFAQTLGGLGGGLSWNRVSDTLIEGWDGAVDTGRKVIALTLTVPATAIGANSSGTVTVTATLLDNYDSHPAAGDDPGFALGSVGVVASDQDGDSAMATVNVAVSDDIPSLDIAGPTTVVEGASINGSWSQTIGADQPGHVTDVVVNGSTYALGAAIDTGKGMLTVNGDFTWTFVAAHNLNNSVAQSVSFTVRVTDADNDVAQDSQTIGITDGANPSVTRNAAVIVDEEALGTLNATGTNPSSTAEASSDTVTFLAGADNITGIAFTTIAGITADVNGNGVADIAWTLDSATQITGRIGGILAITLTLTPPTLPILAGASGSAGVAVTISDNFPHVFGGTSDIVITGVKVTATDSDSDAIDATAQVTVIDDAPIVVTSSNIALAANNLSATGDFKFVVGADSRTSFSAGNSDLNVAMSGLIGSTPTTNHQVVWASEDAHSAVFKIAFDYDPDPTNASNPLVHETGTLGFDKDLGHYTLTLDQEIVGFSTVMTSQTLSKQSYNLVGQSESQPEVVVSKLADQFFVRFTGGEEASGPSTTFTDSGGNGAFAHGETFVGSQAWVSISGGANGVSSDTLQAGEVLNMDFYTASPNGNLNPGPGTATATGMYLKLDGLTGNEDLVVILKLVDPDGSNSPTTRAIVVDAGDIYKSSESNPYGITFADGSDGVVIIEGNDYNFGTENYVIVGAQLLTSTETVTGSNIAIDLNRVTGATGASTSNTKSFGGTTVDNDVIKITDIGVVTTLTTTQILKLDIDVTVTDSDGDSTAVTTLTVNGGVPPVAFDLDGDGLEFVGLSTGVAHDYGSGLVNTAWVSSDDGLLAHAIGGGHDIVFSDDAAGAGSDLEGLRLAYDSNGDGLFDAKDAAFAEFGVWQDLNANGQVDAGEFKSLAEAGIAAIELTSDNQSYTSAGGDVTVLGEASFVRTDGSKGTLGDVLFATSLKEGDAKPAEGSGFTQALVAAGLVAVAGAAEAVEQAPAPVVAAESEVTMDGVPAGPVATAPEPVASDAPATSLAAGADQDAHVSDQPVAPSSHGAEDVAPEHAGLSEGGEAPAAAVAVEAPPADPGDHGALLAQSIDLPPAFDGAAAVLAAHGAAPAAVAQVVAQALGTGSGPDIDALLAALPGGEHAPMPMLTPMLAPMLADAGPAVDAGHMAAAVFDAAMVAHEAMAVAHG